VRADRDVTARKRATVAAQTVRVSGMRRAAAPETEMAEGRRFHLARRCSSGIDTLRLAVATPTSRIRSTRLGAL
jgi:hypothetical protein